MRQLPNRQKKDFNPRSREGSDFLMLMEDSDYIEFQSTLPRRERLLNSYWINKKNTISIHASTKGATTPPNVDYKMLYISIHAPTKGATKGNPNYFEITKISIHAPTKGATRSTLLFDTRGLEFQSTLPRRERRKCKEQNSITQ